MIWYIALGLTLLVLHFTIVSPLLKVWYYRRQGVDEWKFFPITGWQIKNMRRDVKIHKDILYGLKTYLRDGRKCNALIQNILSQVSILLFDPALLQEFFVSKNQYYQKAKLGQTLTTTLFGNGLIFSEGEKWKHSRKLTSNLFTFDRLNSYIPLCEQIVTTEMKSIQTKSNVELLNNFESMTGNLSLSIFFGRTLENEYLEGKPITQVLKDTHQSTLKVYQSFRFLFSGGKSLPNEMHRISTLYKEAFKRMIREQLMENTQSSTMSIIQLYAKAENYIGGEPPKELLDDITSQVLNFFLAGRDTTSHHALMMLYYICLYPEVKSKVIEEIDRIHKDDNLVWDDFKIMTYLEAVSKETHRVYGPVVGIASREALQDHMLGNILIKKGTLVGPGIATNNMNPRYFPEPEKFLPERWLREQKIDTFAFTPFSAGQRNCIGQHFSNIMMKIILVKLFKMYEVTLEPNYELILDFTTTYAPKGGPLFQLVERNQK